MAKYRRRLLELLNITPNINDAGGLEPFTLDFAPDAKRAWIAFHDAVETSLQSGGDLERLKDIASKAGDNCARVAGLFHLLEHGAAGQIGADAVERAGRIVAFHLAEARRFFGELALPPDLADAARLDDWIVATCRREGTEFLPRREIQRNGPLRDSKRLEAALAVLIELERVRISSEGKRKNVAVNPALLGEPS